LSGSDIWQMSVDEQIKIIKRGAEKILPDEEALRYKLTTAQKEGRPLRVKLGIDPTVTDIHLGHTVPLRNLRRFQDLGHTAILVLGDFTATVGDPSGRSKARPPLSHEQVLENAATYKEQVSKILDLERAEVVYNSTWLAKLTLKDLIFIGSHISVKRMLEGEYFGRRFEDPDQTVFLHEMFYPIMQGMDSVSINADIELGGTDQEFNCLMGRDLQRLYGQEPQVVVTFPLLPGLTGTEKMSKSLGNYVGVSWGAQEQFNKLMTMSDDHIGIYYRLLTDVPIEEIEEKIQAIQNGQADPREVKKQLVTEIVSQFHGPEAARRAAEDYERYAEIRRTGGKTDQLPSNIPVAKIKLDPEGTRLTHILVTTGMASSNSEAKRLIRQGGVRLRGEVVKDDTHVITPGQLHEALLQVGSRTPVILQEE